MDFRLTDEQELLRRSVREFAETEIRPHVREWDESQHFPSEIMPSLAELGLLGIQFPEQYGGAGMSAIDYCICIEELARVDPSVCLSIAAHNGLGAAHIFMFGTEDQKQKYLVPLARGEQLARKVLRLVPLHDVRPQLGFRELANAAAQQVLILGQPDVHSAA